MLFAYFNYPNSRATLHSHRECSSVRMNEKPGQRVVVVSDKNLNTELFKFRHREYRFGSQAAVNDLWLVIDLRSIEQDEAVAREVLALLGSHYKRFRDATITRHC